MAQFNPLKPPFLIHTASADDLVRLLRSPVERMGLGTITEVLDRLNALGKPLDQRMTSDFLRQAIVNDNPEHVRFWMNQAQTPTMYGLLCLHERKFDLFRILLESQNNTKHVLDAALAAIAPHDNREAVDFLLEQGADPSYHNHLALREAIEAGTNSVELLLDTLDTSRHGSLVLATAIIHERTDIVRVLLDRGIDPLDDEALAMDRALRSQNREIMKLILDRMPEVPPRIIETALYFKVQPFVMDMLMDKCCFDEVREYIHRRCSSVVQSVFEQVCARRQKDALQNEITNGASFQYSPRTPSRKI